MTPSEPLPGWEAFHISVRAELVNGKPRIIGLRLEPRSGARRSESVLTANRLRTFPVTALAAPAYHLAHLTPGSLTDALEAVLGAPSVEPSARRSRAVTTPEAVAAVYEDAARQGQAPRAAVCHRLNISARTADRYISRARKQGLLAPYNEEE
ncbi:MAG: hypothetical protein R2720_07760 [Candidatus Nanopelagicales bacterium]